MEKMFSISKLYIYTFAHMNLFSQRQLYQPSHRVLQENTAIAFITNVLGV